MEKDPPNTMNRPGDRQKRGCAEGEDGPFYRPETAYECRCHR
jgi:hypothetical protein